MTVSEWITQAMQESKNDTSTVYPQYEQFLKDTGSSMSQSSFERVVRMEKNPLRKDITKILIKTDVHVDADIPEHQSYTLLKRFAKEFKPDMVIDLGDLIDFPYLMRINKTKIRSMSGKRFKRDYEKANRDLDYWQDLCKTYVQLEGNHDYRPDRAIDEEPMLEGMVEFAECLRLKERGIDFIRLEDQPYKLGKLNMIHGWKFNKWFSGSNLETFGGNVVSGHCHRFQTSSRQVPNYNEEIQSWGIGCLCEKQPDYKQGEPTGHQNGFAICYMEPSGKFNLYPVNIVQNSFIWDGELWKL